MPGQPYVAKLPDGRYLAVELPEGSAETDSVTGEVILQAPAIHLLDRLRVLLSPLPPTTTPGRLRLLREALGLSQDELASLAAVDAKQLADWETGKAKPATEQLAELERLRHRAARRGVVLPELVKAS